MVSAEQESDDSPSAGLPALSSPYARMVQSGSKPPLQPVTIPIPSGAGSLFSPKAIILLALGLGVPLWQWNENRPVHQRPGILAPEEPLQTGRPVGKTNWKVGDTDIIPLATYRIKARVLHTERYRWDPVSDIAPLDLGVGWGLMSDEANATRSEFSNAGRFLSWHYSDPGFPGEAASHCIANMHLLPANDRVRSRLLDFREGEIVQMSGYLVQVHRPGGEPWSSSLSRDDTGNGACEIMWVESASVVH